MPRRCTNNLLHWGVGVKLILAVHPCRVDPPPPTGAVYRHPPVQVMVLLHGSDLPLGTQGVHLEDDVPKHAPVGDEPHGQALVSDGSGGGERVHVNSSERGVIAPRLYKQHTTIVGEVKKIVPDFPRPLANPRVEVQILLVGVRPRGDRRTILRGVGHVVHVVGRVTSEGCEHLVSLTCDKVRELDVVDVGGGGGGGDVVVDVVEQCGHARLSCSGGTSPSVVLTV